MHDNTENLLNWLYCKGLIRDVKQARQLMLLRHTSFMANYYLQAILLFMFSATAVYLINTSIKAFTINTQDSLLFSSTICGILICLGSLLLGLIYWPNREAKYDLLLNGICGAFFASIYWFSAVPIVGYCCYLLTVAIWFYSVKIFLAQYPENTIKILMIHLLPLPLSFMHPALGLALLLALLGACKHDKIVTIFSLLFAVFFYFNQLYYADMFLLVKIMFSLYFSLSSFLLAILLKLIDSAR